MYLEDLITLSTTQGIEVLELLRNTEDKTEVLEDLEKELRTLIN